MTADDDTVQMIANEARKLATLAESLGVSLRIDRAPNKPLAMGNMRHVVDAWPARRGIPSTEGHEAH